MSHKTSLSRRIFTSRDALWVGLPTVGVLLTAGGGVALAEQAERSAAHYAAEEDNIQREVREDGFPQVDIYSISSGRVASGTIHLTGNCALNGVQLTLEREPDGGDITDVSAYSFTGYAYPVVDSRYDPVADRYKDTIDGQQVTFTFTGAEDLQENILGETPCQTLAGNLAVQGSIS